MPSFPVILGAVGGILLLVGLVGGGFEFSGSVMPKVGGISRILCFGVGGVLMLGAFAFAALDVEPPPGPAPVAAPGTAASGTPAPGTSPPAVTSTSAKTVPAADAAAAFVGFVLAAADDEIYVFTLPASGSEVVTALPGGSPVQIVCTVQGESVTSPVTGRSSSLWDGTTDGGFVPDVMVDTGTDQPTMPNCTG